jgi:endoglucanase
LSVRVVGDRFVGGGGGVLQLRGVDRPGTEYGCVDGLGFVSSDGGVGGASLGYAGSLVSALGSWNVAGVAGDVVGVVRVPLNEDCWLGINGVPAAFSGVAYQRFVEAEVADLTAAGVYTVLDLHWSAPGGFEATSQNVGPDEDHSVAFWGQVASVFGSNPAVMFDLYNEPHLWCYTSVCNGSYVTADATAWGCYLNGCSYTYSAADSVSEPSGYTFEVAGTQQLVDTIRATGARNVILVEGLGYANAFDDFTAFAPTDPDGQLAVEIHTYADSGSNALDPAGLNQMLADGGLSSDYPIFLGEFGEQICGSAGSDGFTQATIDWANSHGYSWAAWGWDAGEGCDGPTLVSNDLTGTPTTYGQIVETNLQTDLKNQT